MGDDDSSPDVAPGGKRLAFHTRIGRGSYQVVLVDMDGSDMVMLTEGMHPRWSPDGNRLVFVREDDDEKGSIYLINAETGAELVALTSGDISAKDPAWAPDGRRIIFAGAPPREQ